MNRMNSLVAALMLAAVVVAQGARRSQSATPAKEAEVMFGQIDAWSAMISDTAFRMGELARSMRSPESQLEEIAELRDRINKVGANLKALEAERASLSEWEGKALDQVLPLMHEVAGMAEKAIQIFNDNPRRAWATEYVDDAGEISKDADKVATLLHDYLKLAKTREQETRLEHSVGASGF